MMSAGDPALTVARIAGSEACSEYAWMVGLAAFGITSCSSVG
ncbi:MAG: hypothetical protein ACK5RL_09285 [Acidimicrobiales bacterium]